MIQIQYDSYPEETSYELMEMVSEEGQDEVIARHKGSTGDEYKNHDESICLGNGLYSFSLYDSYGDGFGGEYSLALLTGETIIERDVYSVSRYGEQVKFRIPFDRETLDVRTIGSGGGLLTLAPADVFIPTPSPTFGTPAPTTMAPSATSGPSVSMSPSCGDFNVIMSIVYDSYPEETSYELKKVIPEVWPMEWQETGLAHHHEGSAGDKTHEETICLGNGLYSFSFFDAYGDGFGGRYSLALLTGETIIERDNEVLMYGEQVKFRLPFDEATLQVMSYESLVGPSLAPAISITPFPTLYPTTLRPTLSLSSPSPTLELSLRPAQSDIPSRGFNCPSATAVGCTASDPTQFADECSVIGAPCLNGNPGEYCCIDLCPRKYCTAKEASPVQLEGNCGDIPSETDCLESNLDCSWDNSGEPPCFRNVLN